MRHNQSSREEYKSEFSMDGDYEGADGEEGSENWNPELAYDPINDWIDEQDKKEKDAENHRKLMEGLKSLTEIQVLRTVTAKKRNFTVLSDANREGKRVSLSPLGLQKTHVQVFLGKGYKTPANSQNEGDKSHGPHGT